MSVVRALYEVGDKIWCLMGFGVITAKRWGSHNHWQYHIRFKEAKPDEINKIWINETSMERATKLDELLYG